MRSPIKAELRYAVIDQALVSGTAFVTGIVVARFAGPQVFGECNMVWMLVLLVAGFHHSLINAPMMMYGANKSAAKDWEQYTGSLLTHNTVFVLSVGAVAFIAAHGVHYLRPTWQTGAYASVLAVTMFTALTQDFFRRYWFTRGLPQRALSIDVIRYGGQLIGLAVLTMADRLQAISILWMMVIASLAGIALNLPWLQRTVLDRDALRSHTKQHLNFSKWLAGTSITQWFSTQFIVFSAGGILGPVVVGAMKAAQTLMGVTHIILFAFENVVPKNAARYAFERKPAVLENYLLKSSILGTGFTLAVGIALSLAPEFWLALVYGDAYAEYGYTLQIFALAYVMRSIVFIGHAGLRAIEKTPWIFFAEIVAAAIAISIAWVLIHRFGEAGALMGILTVSVVRTLLVMTLLVKGLNLRQRLVHDDT